MVVRRQWVNDKHTLREMCHKAISSSCERELTQTYIVFYFLHLYRAPLYYQSLLFTNECTSDCLKNNIKIYIEIALIRFGAVKPSSGSSLSVPAKVTLC